MSPRGPLWAWIQRALVGLGVLCLAWSAFLVLQARSFAREQRRVLADTRATAKSPAAPRPDRSTATVPLHGLVGVLDIPRLGLSEVVAEGDDDATLNMAIGHLPDTPLPWQAGNSALAGHRNTHFEPLKDIHAGDRMFLSTPQGDFQYVVRRVTIVNPDEVWVLAPTPHRSLTLITCYPFRYIGRAPRRFVIQADDVAAGAASR